ncbi:MAG: zinc finger Ran-binding domain-containing protein [Pyrinomonadaceae bacterium]
MSSIKCKECGLVNFATDAICKRCGTSLLINSSPIPEPASETSRPVTEDGYVLPPPPSVGFYPNNPGVWRDKSTLVMSKGAPLPDRCVKCNEPAHGQRLKRKLSWHHPALYIVIFVALLIYLIIAMILRKTATVEVGLCEVHMAKRRKALLVTWLLVIIGVLGIAGSFVAEDGTYALIGFLFLLAGIIYGVVAARVVAPAKIDDRFVWLKGINKDYLNALPAWPM